MGLPIRRPKDGMYVEAVCTLWRSTSIAGLHVGAAYAYRGGLHVVAAYTYSGGLRGVGGGGGLRGAIAPSEMVKRGPIKCILIHSNIVNHTCCR